MRSHISTQLWVLHCSQPFIMPPNREAVEERRRTVKRAQLVLLSGRYFRTLVSR